MLTVLFGTPASQYTLYWLSSVCCSSTYEVLHTLYSSSPLVSRILHRDARSAWYRANFQLFRLQLKRFFFSFASQRDSLHLKKAKIKQSIGRYSSKRFRKKCFSSAVASSFLYDPTTVQRVTGGLFCSRIYGIWSSLTRIHHDVASFSLLMGLLINCGNLYTRLFSLSNLNH